MVQFMSMTRKDREKQAREEEIVDAAMKIFGEKGFEGASMDEIAQEAEFTKRTLYQYFESKEELFYAAAHKGFLMLIAYLECTSKPEASGYDRLVQGSFGYYRFYKECPQIMRLIGEIGAVKKRTGPTSPRLAELMKTDNHLFQWVIDGIREGIADGSIRKEVDPALTAFGIIFLMTGFFNQLSATGETFMQHFSIDAEAFCTHSMNLLFGSIQAGSESRVKEDTHAPA